MTPQQQQDLARILALAKLATPGYRLNEFSGKQTIVSNMSHPVAEISAAGHRLCTHGTGKDGEFLAEAHNMASLLRTLAAENAALVKGQIGMVPYEQYHEDVKKLVEEISSLTDSAIKLALRAAKTHLQINDKVRIIGEYEHDYAGAEWRIYEICDHAVKGILYGICRASDGSERTDCFTPDDIELLSAAPAQATAGE